MTDSLVVVQTVHWTHPCIRLEQVFPGIKILVMVQLALHTRHDWDTSSTSDSGDWSNQLPHACVCNGCGCSVIAWLAYAAWGRPVVNVLTHVSRAGDGANCHKLLAKSSMQAASQLCHCRGR